MLTCSKLLFVQFLYWTHSYKEILLVNYNKFGLVKENGQVDDTFNELEHVQDVLLAFASKVLHSLYCMIAFYLQFGKGSGV